MRKVFWALVFANIAYFGWSHWVDVPRPPPVNETVPRLPRLKLATEQPPAPPRARVAPEKTSVAESVCLSVGPFRDADNSAQAAALLQGKGFESRQRTTAGKSSTDYPVYIGGLKSDAEANGIVRGLQEVGFTGVTIVPDGSEAGRRVSLGVFSDRDRADERSWAARLKGFEAEVAERKSSATLYWVDLAAPAGPTPLPTESLFA